MTVTPIDREQAETIINELIRVEIDSGAKVLQIIESIIKVKGTFQSECTKKFIQVDFQAEEDFTQQLRELFQKLQWKRIAVMAILGLDLSIEQLEPLESVLPILGKNRFCIAVDRGMGTSIRLLIGVYRDSVN